MSSFNPWLVFVSFCCVIPMVFGFACVRIGISIGRRGMPHFQRPLRFGRYVSSSQVTGADPSKINQKPMRSITDQQRHQEHS